ncbi:hypothetical protein JTB14_016969 [Gonioctena quinquepunctata]|nr:hypothetical protein JTB14_016969 [Gonioctena quinquepunctata]
MASTAFGVGTELQVQRWDGKLKEHVNVTCPTVVCAFNEKMNGVDLCDQMIECCRTFFKTRKWTLKTMFYLFDLSIVNNWMDYRTNFKAHRKNARELMELLTFTLNIAEYLLCGTRNRSAVENMDENCQEQTALFANKTAPMLTNDKRFDG